MMATTITKQNNNDGKDTNANEEMELAFNELAAIHAKFMTDPSIMHYCFAWLIAEPTKTPLKPKEIKTEEDAIIHTFYTFAKFGDAFVKRYSMSVYNRVSKNLLP